MLVEADAHRLQLLLQQRPGGVPRPSQGSWAGCTASTSVSLSHPIPGQRPASRPTPPAPKHRFQPPGITRKSLGHPGQPKGRRAGVPSTGQGVSKALLLGAGLLVGSGQHSAHLAATAQPQPPHTSLWRRPPTLGAVVDHPAPALMCNRAKCPWTSHQEFRDTRAAASILPCTPELPWACQPAPPHHRPLNLALRGVQHHDDDVSCAGHSDHLPATAFPWSGGGTSYSDKRRAMGPPTQGAQIPSLKDPQGLCHLSPWSRHVS